MRSTAFISAALVACAACGGGAPRSSVASNDSRAASVAAPAPSAGTIAPSPTLPADSQAQISGLLSDGVVAWSAGDSVTARELFAQALQLDPGNAALQARVRTIAPASTAVPARTVARVLRGRVVASAGGEVALAAAAAPVDTTVRAAVRFAPARSVGAARAAAQARRDRVVARARAREESQVAAVDSSVDVPQVISVVDSGVVMPTPKHKRTWPWTRAQRWLVAKGLTGGAGVGVVVGAIVGNVPGAVLAGSLGGGALGFKKATKIGPAEPYPSERKTAQFERRKAERDERVVTAREARADSSARVVASAEAASDGALALADTTVVARANVLRAAIPIAPQP